MSESRGITLIVLIITIVVLLILAGVAVAHITGGEGIIEQASERRDEATIANEKQIISNAIIAATAKFGDITEENLRSALSKNNVEITKKGILYKIVFKDTNNSYKMNPEGEFFYIEDIAPTEMWGKIENNILYLRSTQQDGYSIGTKWNNADITKIIIEEPIAPSTCKELFNGCIALQEIENIENLHTENATSMEKMFYNCKKLKSLDLTYFDTSKVESMSYLFYNCIALKELNVKNFDTSNVKSMAYMFAGPYYSTGQMNLEKINGLTSFNTSEVTTMAYMFSMCVKIKTLDVSSFDTSKVTNMSYMFSGCWADKRVEMSLEKITGLENFNTANVNNMSYMFHECAKLTNLNLKSFNTSSVTNMMFMFCYCRSLTNLDISNFNTSKISSMYRMFGYCGSLKTLDISGFDTQLVTSMNTMFSQCNNLKTIYASEKFVTTKVTDSNQMFYSSTNIVGGQGTKSGYNDNISYAHIDGGPSNPGYFTLKEN